MKTSDPWADEKELHVGIYLLLEMAIAQLVSLATCLYE
jgi:hypothetical protein